MVTSVYFRWPVFVGGQGLTTQSALSLTTSFPAFLDLLPNGETWLIIVILQYYTYSHILALFSFDVFCLSLCLFLTNRTAYRSKVGYCLLSSVRPSVSNAMHCGSQGWCTGLKVVPACS